MRIVIEHDPVTEDIKISSSEPLGARFLLRVLDDAHNAVMLNAKEHRPILAVDAQVGEFPNGRHLRGVGK